MLCQYSDIFGKPGQGIHSIRIFNIAIIDVILTILLGYFISKYYQYSLLYTIAGLFILGIILHKVFCVKTTVNNLLF